jgi:hypothetical protein
MRWASVEIATCVLKDHHGHPYFVMATRQELDDLDDLDGSTLEWLM